MKRYIARKCPQYLTKHYSIKGAKEALEGFGKGREVCCVTHGQFSLADVLEVIIEGCQPLQAVDISTWTAAGWDAARMLELVEQSGGAGMRWVVDSIFVNRQLELCEALLQSGAEMRIMKTHAKFALISGGGRKLTVRTSMNLNANPRWEFVEASESAELWGFFSSLVDGVFSSEEAGRVRLSDLETEDGGEKWEFNL